MIAIVGAGPCGLGCAWELTRLGHEEWILFEAGEAAGGLGSSVTDARGFTWDHGGHVVFSHFGEFDRLLDEVLGEEVLCHERSSYVRVAGGWVPYPFQNNLRHLPAEEVVECLAGLARAPGAAPGADFATWMTGTFGPGITRLFMRPYNFKVWATPPEQMSATWMAERVAVIDFERALRSVVLQEDDVAWGPNNLFRFPKRGGTGEIYRRLATRLGGRIRFQAPVVSVNARRRTLTLADGSRHEYASLLSTMPLDSLVEIVEDAPAEVREAAAGLRHNSVLVVGVGVEAPLADDRSWLYFPEPDVPFYRVTNFAKYSPANVPGGDTGRYSAYMTETAYSPDKPVDRDGLPDAALAGLISSGLVAQGTPIASVHLIDVPHAYPIPTLDRDERLATVQPWLERLSILSRGRFGAWRYEAGNMDHAVKMGIDAARRFVTGSREELWRL